MDLDRVSQPVLAELDFTLPAPRQSGKTAALLEERSLGTPQLALRMKAAGHFDTGLRAQMKPACDQPASLPTPSRLNEAAPGIYPAWTVRERPHRYHDVQPLASRLRNLRRAARSRYSSTYPQDRSAFSCIHEYQR